MKRYFCKFSEKQKMRFQERLVKYIITFENKSSRQELRDYLGVTNERYSDYRSLKKPHGRFTNALEFFDKLANLGGLEKWEFIRWIEGKKSRINKLGEIDSLRPWEDILLGAFDRIDLTLRKDLVDICRESLKDPEKFCRVVKMIIELYKLNRDLDVADAFLRAVSLVRKNEQES